MFESINENVYCATNYPDLFLEEIEDFDYEYKR